MLLILRFIDEHLLSHSLVEGLKLMSVRELIPVSVFTSTLGARFSEWHFSSSNGSSFHSVLEALVLQWVHHVYISIAVLYARHNSCRSTHVHVGMIHAANLMGSNEPSRWCCVDGALNPLILSSSELDGLPNILLWEIQVVVKHLWLAKPTLAEWAKRSRLPIRSSRHHLQWLCIRSLI